eukprot:TRINITY_DN110_c0_g1_i1.p3 TRINITY_DN110_c0_g1~~TRINITY_DN110_c0_g1_i1.p3  ORF type:complete len:372 (-),score=43.99 TRINITY_DN110_c0_g1_i1:2968-4083(-)
MASTLYQETWEKGPLPSKLPVQNNRVKLVKCPDETLAAAKIFKSQRDWLHEQRIMKKLSSSRTLRVLDWNESGSLTPSFHGLQTPKTAEGYEDLKGTSFPYLIMELAENGELYDYLEICGPLNEKIARFYFWQIMDAVENLHEKGIIHRDIKPQNILLGENFEAKLADFGLASRAKDEEITSAKGTLSYMPPEALRRISPQNSFEWRQKADIYSAGVVLFNLVTGYMPYSKASPEDKLFALLLKNPEKFWAHHRKHVFEGSLDEDLEELLTGMLNPDPERRWDIKQIKSSMWFNGKTAEVAKVVREMERRKACIDLAKDCPPEKRVEVIRSCSAKFRSKSKKRKERGILEKVVHYKTIGTLLWNIYSSLVS